MLRASIFVLIGLFLIIGCDEDSNPVTPPQPSIYTIQLTGLPESVTAPEGVQRDLPFQIMVINNSTKEVVSGASVNIAVPSGMGTITPATSMTNGNGIVEATYSFDVSAGESTATIFITADKQSHVATIDLFGTKHPVNLSLTPRDTSLYAQRGDNCSFDLTAVITDENGIGIAGTNVLFEVRPDNNYPADTLFGSLTPVVETDKNGVATTTFSSSGGQGHLIIKCSVDEGEQFNDVAAEMVISVSLAYYESGVIIVYSNRDYIYADQGVTQARVTAVLKDEYNQSLVGKAIIFTSNNNGAISSPIITDSLGIAIATFSDVGLQSMNALGEREPCDIHAIYEPLGVDVSIEIDIRPQEIVDNIVLVAGRASMSVGSSDTTWVRATCYLNEARTQVAPMGARIHFIDLNNLGSFTNRSAQVGIGGIAETYFIASGSTAGQAELVALINPDEGGEYHITSNSVYIDLIPGPPETIYVYATPYELRIGPEGERSTITAVVVDTFGNPVRDGSILVLFSTTLGSVDPPNSVTEDGRAISFLQPGQEAGVSTVTAYVMTPDGEISAQTHVTILAGGEASIELTANPNIVAVAGTGGNTQSILSAVVRDANGNLVEVPASVVFEIITNDQPPESGNLNNNDPFNMDTSLTSSGIATVTYNSGQLSGSTIIRAYIIDSEGESTGVQASTSIATASGHPENISIDVNSEGIDAGGGAWSIEVSAIVRDAYQNPAQDLIPVIFNIAEEDVAVINVGFTGNEGIRGRPTPGVAYATLTYNSINTFMTTTIEAYVRTEMVCSVGGRRVLDLPLQRGELELHVDPENGMIDGDEMLDFKVWSILRDGHGVEINDAPIIFGSNRAQFYYDRGGINRPNFEAYAPDPVRRFTGSINDGDTPNARIQDDDPNGNAVVWLRGDERDFFLDPFTQEITVQIGATVEGYNDIRTEPEFIYVTRQE